MTEQPRPTLAPAEPIHAVLFDFHYTLVDQRSGADWVQLAWRRAGRRGDPVSAWGRGRASQLARRMDTLWDTAREVDPGNARDLSQRVHRRVFDQLLADLADSDPDLVQALHDTIPETWFPYADAAAVLSELRSEGVRTALVSNVAVDVRPALAAHGLADGLDEVVLSFEAGSVKPDAVIFARALDLLGVAPERALMVGDSWRDDGGAAQLGIRTLILPRVPGPRRGLGTVLDIIRPVAVDPAIRGR